MVLNGRGVKTVDVHAHCAVPEAMALMGSKVSREALLMVQEPLRERLRAMDAQGIDMGDAWLPVKASEACAQV